MLSATHCSYIFKKYILSFRSVSGKKLCSTCRLPLGKGAAMIIETLGLYFHINCFRVWLHYYLGCLKKISCYLCHGYCGKKVCCNYWSWTLEMEGRGSCYSAPPLCICIEEELEWCKFVSFLSNSYIKGSINWTKTCDLLASNCADIIPQSQITEVRTLVNVQFTCHFPSIKYLNAGIWWSVLK